jgi:acyl carrier protein
MDAGNGKSVTLHAGDAHTRRLESATVSTQVTELEMERWREVAKTLDDVLGLRGRSASFTPQTHLLGALPELDSMAVVSLIAALEDRFDIMVDDDEIDGATFATVGSLSDFVDGKAANSAST